MVFGNTPAVVTTPDPTVIHLTVDISPVGMIDQDESTLQMRFTFEQATAGEGETAGALPAALQWLSRSQSLKKTILLHQ